MQHLINPVNSRRPVDMFSCAGYYAVKQKHAQTVIGSMAKLGLRLWRARNGIIEIAPWKFDLNINPVDNYNWQMK